MSSSGSFSSSLTPVAMVDNSTTFEQIAVLGASSLSSNTASKMFGENVDPQLMLNRLKALEDITNGKNKKSNYLHLIKYSTN